MEIAIPAKLKSIPFTGARARCCSSKIKLGTRGGGPRLFEPPIEPPDPSQQVHEPNRGSRVETVRHKYLVRMAKVRDAINELEQSTRHALADVDLAAGSRDMFIQNYETLGRGDGVPWIFWTSI